MNVPPGYTKKLMRRLRSKEHRDLELVSLARPGDTMFHVFLTTLEGHAASWNPDKPIKHFYLEPCYCQLHQGMLSFKGDDAYFYPIFRKKA